MENTKDRLGGRHLTAVNGQHPTPEQHVTDTNRVFRSWQTLDCDIGFSYGSLIDCTPIKALVVTIAVPRIARRQGTQLTNGLRGPD